MDTPEGVLYAFSSFAKSMDADICSAGKTMSLQKFESAVSF